MYDFIILYMLIYTIAETELKLKGKKKFPSKNVSPLKIKHEYNETQNNTNNNNKYHLLTEIEVIALKSQTEALMIHQGRGLKFPCNDRTGEVNKLFIIWPF